MKQRCVRCSGGERQSEFYSWNECGRGRMKSRSDQADIVITETGGFLDY